jgi:hypothetical protein
MPRSFLCRGDLPSVRIQRASELGREDVSSGRLRREAQARCAPWALRATQYS